MVLGSGIYFSLKLNFLQLNIFKIIKNLFDKNISNLKSLCITLGAKIGVGSLAGISLAIYLGGPGTIFWFWTSSLIMSINTYVEVYLLVKYNKKNSTISGPSKYIFYGLNNKYLAILYSIIVVLSYVIGFIPIQANTIVKSISTVSNINNIIIIISLVFLIVFILFRNTNYIVKTCTFLVPLMTIIYLILGLYIIIKNINVIPSIIISILKEALTIKNVLIPTVIIGLQRSLFATEAGIGTSALSIDNQEYNAKKAALSQVFGIHITTFIICTITAFIIFTSDYTTLSLNNINGIEIITYAFFYHLGKMGGIILSIITILFAISTIISGYFYGEVSINNIFPKTFKNKKFFFKLLTISLVLIGSIISSSFIWNIIDILITFMAIINIYAIFSLRKEVDK
jgi:AGCS family alanine or glycine:cation symporter